MRRFAAAAVLACLAFVGLATPALAHNSLVESNPRDKASVEVSPDSITLTFDQPVQPGDGINTISVLDPQNNHWEAAPPQVDSSTVSAPLRPLGPSGEYKIAWRILSADGHPVQGQLSFTLSKAGNGTPLPADELAKFKNGAGAAQSDTSEDSGGVPTWVWIVGAVLVLGVGIVFALRMGGKDEEA
ncbi:copper resistance CopC family protein [Kibdelosporangium phytohabitans]|uniref:Copper resistance protein CopC n=1 Tax=Kibdelosporangium phytohabitans TaxID=860235 RepID=A0A0N9HS12_9PSEU|nr:copper resistance CopC family protein [Kibdelosporangium phytohabitans]ALG05565.1 copper resistance protein CopC [Kibdelosporangium phytohabitans]MBE1466475.1 methionine-rich copper-binding protein CopC [Kibdelosporangium phytohabitans]